MSTPIAWTIIVLVAAYIVGAFILGRQLVYNDVFAPRQLLDPSQLGGQVVEDVTFPGADGLTLRGWFVHGRNNPSGRTLILLHGWMSTRMKLAPQTKALVESGFNVLVYDQRSHGKSDTGLITYGPNEGRDFAGAIAFLRSRSDVDIGNLGVVAFSLGTGSIIYGLDHVDRSCIRAIVLEGAFANSYDVGEQMLVQRFGALLGMTIGHLFFTPGSLLASFGRFRHSDAVAKVGSLRSIPLLLIRGENDHLVPAASFAALAAAAPDPKEIWIHSAGGHTRACQTYPDEYRGRVVGFLNRHLAPRPVTAAQPGQSPDERVRQDQ